MIPACRDRLSLIPFLGIRTLLFKIVHFSRMRDLKEKTKTKKQNAKFGILRVHGAPDWAISSRERPSVYYSPGTGTTLFAAAGRLRKKPIVLCYNIHGD